MKRLPSSLAALVLAALAACGGGGSKPPAASGTPVELPDPIDIPAGCEAARRVPIEGTSHVSPPQRVAYKTNPPTSGEHYSSPGIGPAAPGAYTEAPPDEGLVHNLEHGHVVIWHTSAVSKEQLDSLREVVTQAPRFRLMVPRTSMPYQVAFTSWGVIQGCRTPTAQIAAAAEAFAKRFQQKAPENIPGRPLV